MPDDNEILARLSATGSTPDSVTNLLRCAGYSGMTGTACKVLRDQIGRHSKWVFVHTEPKTRSDGTVAPAMRKMRVDSNTAWRLAKKTRRHRKLPISRFKTHLGKLVNSSRSPIINFAGNGRLGIDRNGA